MAKSARSSAVKKNKQHLKRKVFGPAETARNDRLSSKLLELASQPKPPRAEMEVEDEAADLENKSDKDKDVNMNADAEAAEKPATRSNTSYKRQKAVKIARVEKKRHQRKPRNVIVFPKHPKKSSRPGKR